MQDNLSKDQLNAMVGMNTVSPQQSSAALGHSNSVITNALGMGWNALQSVSMGAVKGAESTELGIGELASKAVGAQGVTSTLEHYKQSPDVQAQNLGEKVGKTGEQIGEFFLPGGAEKGVLEKGASYIDKLPELLGIAGKGATALTGALKTALHGVTTGATFGGVTAAQTGDLQKAKGAAEFGTVAGGLSGLLETFGPGIGTALQKSGFKLSAAQEAKAAQKMDTAAKFMSENKILGSDSAKFAKLKQLNSSLESTLQSSLSNAVQIPKQAVEDNITSTVEQLRTEDPAIYQQAKSAADKAIALMKSSEGDTVGLKDALSAKRSYGTAAFKQSKFAVRDPNVVSEGSYAVEQGFQKALEDTLSGAQQTIKIPPSLGKYFNGAKEVSLQDFNKVYSNAITAKNLTNLARFKSDSGLVGRFFGLWAGETIGQAVAPGLVGKFVGAGLGEAVSQKAVGLGRNLLERAVSEPQLPEQAGKVIQASGNQ